MVGELRGPRRWRIRISGRFSELGRSSGSELDSE